MINNLQNQQRLSIDSIAPPNQNDNNIELLRKASLVSSICNEKLN